MTTTADVLPTDEDNEESRPVNDQEAAESESNQLSAASSSELPSPATKHEERLKRLGELRMRLVRILVVKRCFQRRRQCMCCLRMKHESVITPSTSRKIGEAKFRRISRQEDDVRNGS